MKPHPVGRFLVDLPESAEMGNWYQRYQGTGRICLALDITPDEYKDTIDARVTELNSVTHEEGGALLEKDVKLNFPTGRVLLYWHNEYLKGSFLEAPAYALIGSTMYKFEAETESDPIAYTDHVNYLDELFSSIRPLKPDEIPSEHGFCFDHSILVDQPRSLVENVIASAIWLDRPDVHFRFSTFTNGRTTDPPLLQRLKKGNHYSGTRVLRSGRRDLASGEMGEEHLERVKEENGTVGHLFVWEAPGLTNNQCNHPQIRLDMSTGNGLHGPENSSLSDEDALKLWDAMVNSIRLRPVAKPKA
jgi:hypothetical protein